MERRSQNWKLISNEYFYLLACYVSLAFSEYADGPETVFDMGYVFLLVLLLMILLNVSLLVAFIIHKAKNKIKEIIQKRKQSQTLK